MKTILILLFTLFAFVCARADDDVRSKVIGAGKAPALSRQINPDKDIYGIPFGTSEDEFIKAYGKPTGYVRLEGQDTAMLYGTTHAGKLVGVRITHNLLDWKLMQGTAQRGLFNEPRWSLNNGIRQEMNRREVKEILSGKLRNESHFQFYYLTEKARVDLDFSHYTQEGEADEAYRVHGILVRQGPPKDDSLSGVPTTPGLKTRAKDALVVTEGLGTIGVTLGPGDGEGLLDILSVLPRGAAEKAGIRPGWLIVSVDGVATEGRSTPEVTQMIRGKPGTKVTLELWNLESDKTNKVTITRESFVPQNKPKE
jgi:hypothetical protein